MKVIASNCFHFSVLCFLFQGWAISCWCVLRCQCLHRASHSAWWGRCIPGRKNRQTPQTSTGGKYCKYFSLNAHVTILRIHNVWKWLKKSHFIFKNSHWQKEIEQFFRHIEITNEFSREILSIISKTIWRFSNIVTNGWSTAKVVFCLFEIKIARYFFFLKISSGVENPIWQSDIFSGRKLCMQNCCAARCDVG